MVGGIVRWWGHCEMVGGHMVRWWGQRWWGGHCEMVGALGVGDIVRW